MSASRLLSFLVFFSATWTRELRKYLNPLLGVCRYTFSSGLQSSLKFFRKHPKIKKSFPVGFACAFFSPTEWITPRTFFAINLWVLSKLRVRSRTPYIVSEIFDAGDETRNKVRLTPLLFSSFPHPFSCDRSWRRSIRREAWWKFRAVFLVFLGI